MTSAFFWEGRPVSEVRAREIQGLLAMLGAGSEAETGDAAPAAVSAHWRADPGGAPRPTPTPARAERATADAGAEPLPYRTVLASWPDEWRERWGLRANDLETSGLSWRDAEGRAFLEVWKQWRQAGDDVGRN
jgi:hypothetical protein